MTEQDIRRLLDQARHAIFLGEELLAETPALTQEDYLDQYEARTERNPLREKELLRQAITPLLATYQHTWKMDNAAAALMTGDSLPEPEDETEWLMEIYDEMMNTDTEEEWEQLIGRFMPRSDKEA
ncbi:hypothetical protein DFP93_11519 [Aneurinibacillus soli]|uniref:Uncharacterized protein n=1 Tax=Aneurinibacillus soli TaxID=1500254 RepID=A0A0U5BGL6_9BACL|nr:hypothetical protein [Aneurinibacillus soli]PYE59863.1 hypothetical protein DFP93_11519 [Aneurinibacillus soli]BAU29415.1 hypothetical protein CB4_03615 [Aneurinibacillus soli]